MVPRTASYSHTFCLIFRGSAGPEKSTLWWQKERDPYNSCLGQLKNACWNFSSVNCSSFLQQTDHHPTEKLGELKGTELKRRSLPTFSRHCFPSNTAMCVCVCVCVVVGVSVSRSCNKKKHKIKWQRQKCFIKIYMSIICNCREKEEKRTRRKEKMEKEMLQRSLLRGV